MQWNDRKEGEGMNSYVVRPILRDSPKVGPFIEAVLRAAAETDVTVAEMKEAFEVLISMAEQRARWAKVGSLNIKLPEVKE